MELMLLDVDVLVEVLELHLQILVIQEVSHQQVGMVEQQLVIQEDVEEQVQQQEAIQAMEEIMELGKEQQDLGVGGAGGENTKYPMNGAGNPTRSELEDC